HLHFNPIVVRCIRSPLCNDARMVEIAAGLGKELLLVLVLVLRLVLMLMLMLVMILLRMDMNLLSCCKLGWIRFRNMVHKDVVVAWARHGNGHLKRSLRVGDSLPM